MKVTELKTFHATIWEGLSKKSFVIQLIVILWLVSYCTNVILVSNLRFLLLRFGAMISFPLFFLRPILGIFAIIILTASIIDDLWLPLIPFFGVGSLHITDVILATLFLFIIGKKFYYKKFYHYNYSIIRTPLDIPLILFFLSIVFALINGLFIQKSEFNLAFRTFRFFGYYLLFFLITNHVRDKKDLSLFLRGVFLIGTVTALFCIAQQIVGRYMPIIFGRVERLETAGFGAYGEVTRTIPPGILLVLLTLILLVCLGISGKFQGRSLILLWGNIIILASGLVFTYYRNMWMATALALFLVFILTTAKQKARIIHWSLVGIWGIILCFLFATIAPSKKLNQIGNATGERILSIFKVRGVTGPAADTLKGRAMESEWAFEKIMEHPILGIGFGTHYRPVSGIIFSWVISEEAKEVTRKKDIGLMRERWYRRMLEEEEKKKEEKRRREKIYQIRFAMSYKALRFHNSLLEIPQRLGIFGFISFIWVSALFLYRGFRNWKKIKDPFSRAICLGCTVAYLGTLFSSTLEPFLNTWRGIIGIAIMWGTNEVIYRVEGIDSKK